MSAERPRLDDLDKRLLMELQYRFPLSETPYAEAARRLGVEVGVVLERLHRLSEQGVLKRVGFYLNYKSYGHVAALVALRVENPEEASRLISSRLTVTHSYVRDHPHYNLWVVAKAPSREELNRAVEEAAAKLGADYSVLWSKRVYRLSVKYDLYSGVSRAGPYSRVAASPPRPEELGVPLALARELRRLPLAEKPYAEICRRHGCSASWLAAAARRLLEAGVLGDPGAALNGHLLGFTYNGMVVMEAGGGYEELCGWVLDNLPEATHVVLREPWPPGSWRHNCFAMIHAVSREAAASVLERIDTSPRVRDYTVITSLKDLMPGAVR